MSNFLLTVFGLYLMSKPLIFLAVKAWELVIYAGGPVVCVGFFTVFFVLPALVDLLITGGRP